MRRTDYRGKVVTIAKVIEINGYVKNLADGRVKVVAEANEPDLERFAKALATKNTVIDVSVSKQNTRILLEKVMASPRCG